MGVGFLLFLILWEVHSVPCDAETPVAATLTEFDENYRWSRSTQELIGFTGTTNDVFKTVDGGITWTDDSDNWPNWAAINTISPLRLGNTMYPYVAADGVMYFFRAGGHTWISLDNGETVEYADMGHQFIFLSINPADSALILGFWQTECCADTSDCTACTQELILSTDNGRTWEVLMPGFRNEYNFVAWTEDGSAIILQTPDNEMVYSEDFFETSTTLLYPCYSFFYSGDALVARTWEINEYALKASRDLGATWELLSFADDSTNNNHIIITTEPGNVWVGRTDYSTSTNYMELYVSDTFNSHFHFSLAGVLENPWGFYDFDDIEGIKLANVLNEGGVTSWITTDSGLKWRRVALNSDCAIDACLLNLQPDDFYDTLVKRADAPGLIIASGSLGASRTADLNIYVTTDAGKSWTQVDTGNKNLVMDTYGEVLVSYVPDESSFSYTRDFTNWLDCALSFPGKTVQIVRPFPNIGSLGGDKNYMWFLVLVDTDTVVGPVRTTGIVHVDLTDSQLPVCVHDDQNWDASDFELFTPYGTDCILGARVVIFRKKPGTLCHYDSVAGPAVGAITYEPCTCTREDYLCEVCWVPDPNESDLVCIQDTSDQTCPAYDPTLPPEDCPEGSTYSGAPSYRKNEGSVCITDTALEEELLASRTVPCPTAGTPTGPPAGPSEPPAVPADPPSEGPPVIGDPPQGCIDPNECNPPIYSYPPGSSSDSPSNSQTAIIVGVIVGTIGVAVLGFVLFFFLSKHPAFFSSLTGGSSSAPPPKPDPTPEHNNDSHQQTLEDSS